jgi:oligopeptide/dipeptide ABC transporter ATP-binding protein
MENMEERTKILEVKNLKTHFHTYQGVVRAVDDVSFDLYQGEILGIVGESGGGKSITGFSIIKLIDEPGIIEQGEINFEGKNIVKMSDYEMNKIRGKEISMIFQDPMTSLKPVYTIGRQLEEVLILHENLSKAERHKRCVELLNSVGISNAEKRLQNYPHEFSGGMRQRVMIAMGLSCNPKILIADEPTTALDVTVQAQILDLIRDLRKDFGTAIVWISHDLGVVAGLAERVLVMYAGFIVEDAPVDQLYANPKHPYTEGLLASLPTIEDDSKKRLDSIKGLPPYMNRLPQGCPFAPRCKYAMDICYQKSPQLTYRNQEKTHMAACWLDDLAGLDSKDDNKRGNAKKEIIG